MTEPNEKKNLHIKNQSKLLNLDKSHDKSLYKNNSKSKTTKSNYDINTKYEQQQSFKNEPESSISDLASPSSHAPLSPLKMRKLYNDKLEKHKKTLSSNFHLVLNTTNFTNNGSNQMQTHHTSNTANVGVACSIDNFKVDDEYYKKLLKLDIDPINGTCNNNKKDTAEKIKKNRHLKKASCNNEFFLKNKISAMLGNNDRKNNKISSVQKTKDNSNIKDLNNNKDNPVEITNSGKNSEKNSK